MEKCKCPALALALALTTKKPQRKTEPRPALSPKIMLGDLNLVQMLKERTYCADVLIVLSSVVFKNNNFSYCIKVNFEILMNLRQLIT